MVVPEKGDSAAQISVEQVARAWRRLASRTS
jgi:hypothetical protein